MSDTKGTEDELHLTRGATIKLRCEPELRAKLLARARRSRMTLAAYLRSHLWEIVEQEPPAPPAPAAQEAHA